MLMIETAALTTEIKSNGLKEKVKLHKYYGLLLAFLPSIFEEMKSPTLRK